MHLSRFAVAAILFGALPRVAHGGEKGPDAVRAEALFDEGRRLMAAGDFTSACPKFASSQALDPAIGTALNLANCYEKDNKLASAWEAYRSAEAAAAGAKQKDRAAFAKKKAAGLQGKLSRLTINVPARVQVTGLEIRCDGQPVQPPEWGIAVPHDGGTLGIEVSAPGKKKWTSQAELKPTGQNLVVDVPPLDDAPAPPPSAPIAAAPVQSTPQPPVVNPSEPKTEHRGRTQRVLGFVIGGVGLAGMGTAGALALVARSQFKKAEKESAETQHSDSLKAVRTGNIATIVVSAGGAVTVLGALLWITAPSSSITVGTNGRELLLEGSF